MRLKIKESFKQSDFWQNGMIFLNKLTFYQFDNLKQYFPQLESITQFITTADFLGRIKIEVIGAAGQVNRLAPADKLDATIHVLTRLASEIQTGTTEFIGTKEFKPEAIQVCVKDKTLSIVLDDTGDKEFGWGVRESRNMELILDLQGQDWYVYDENYGTVEEKYFVKFIYRDKLC